MSERPKAPWTLQGGMDGSKSVWTVPIQVVPFRVGRQPGLDLTLPTSSVSAEHAEIFEVGEDLYVRDVGSTNGTFVNGRRITEEAIRAGDLLHFADVGFRLVLASPVVLGREATAVLREPLDRLFEGAAPLEELLRTAAVVCHYQPIVDNTGGVIGYEALGRGRHPALPEDPVRLFELAAHLGSAERLSRLLRTVAIQGVRGRPEVPALFLNTHPLELPQIALTSSFAELRKEVADLPLVVEVHEAAIVNADVIRDLRAPLRDMGISMAYDDFGSGQARLLELAEVPPDYLKFDIRFVRGIAGAPASKQRLVRSLVALATDLGVRSVAEGVENAEDAAVCWELGFGLAQGFYLGSPRPLGDDTTGSST